MAKYITKFTIVAREHSYSSDRPIVNEYFLTEKRNEHDVYWTKEELITDDNPIREFQTSREAVLTLSNLEPCIPCPDGCSRNRMQICIAIVCDDCIVGYIPILEYIEI